MGQLAFAVNGFVWAGITLGCLFLLVIFFVRIEDKQYKVRRAAMSILKRENMLSGLDLQNKIRTEYKLRISAPGFYVAMKKLEEEKYIHGWYENLIIAGGKVRERRYKLTEKGEAFLDAYPNSRA